MLAGSAVDSVLDQFGVVFALAFALGPVTVAGPLPDAVRLIGRQLCQRG